MTAMRYIVYNGFWNTAPSDPVLRISEAAARRGMTFTPVPHTAFTVQVAPSVQVWVNGTPVTERDTVVYWDKDTRLATALEKVGARVYNRAAAIAACDDKSETHRILAQGGVPMPRTLLAPMAYTDITAAIEPFLMTAEQTLGFPMVVKECYGSFGRQVSLVHTAAELRECVWAMGNRPFILQEFIAESAGRDIRLYVVGERVIAAITRRSENDFRANVELGGKAEAYTPTAEQEALAKRCIALLGLDFGAVDLLEDEEHNTLVCEVNSNAYMAGLSAATGVDAADEIVAYIVKGETQWNN